ncbi:hypothetical protein ASE25_10540 [Terrabacter sp. Root85]|nr:hypothetical protein ASE25_10540 [Terrabacter sp. Root85]
MERWFAEYLEFAVVARSERDVVELLQWYSVPLTITLDDAAIQMATAEEVVAVVGSQVKQLQAEGFVRSVELVGETTVLNGSPALRGEELVRRRADDSAIEHVNMTYVLVRTHHDDMRVAVMAVHASGT